jgi:hypothetical protein
MGAIQEIPKTALRAGLWATRLPLTMAASLRGRDADEWPPLLVFDGLAAGVREFAGGVLHDEDLVHAARLERAKVSQLRKATELDTVATAAREQADAEYHDRRARDEEQRKTAARQTRTRAASLEQEQAEKRRRAASGASKRKQAVRQSESATKQQLAKQERATHAAELRAEREVLKNEGEAVAASGAALDAERELRATKAARRSSGPHSSSASKRA